MNSTEKETPEPFAAWLTAQRTSHKDATGRKYTQQSFAEAVRAKGARASLSLYGHWETGERTPGARAIKAIAEVLRTSPADLEARISQDGRAKAKRADAEVRDLTRQLNEARADVQRARAEADARVAAVTSIAPAEERLLRAIREAEHADPGGVDLVDGVIALVESMPRAPLTGPYGAPEPTDPAGQARRALAELSTIADPVTRALLFGMITTAAKAAKGIASAGYRAPDHHRTPAYTTRGAEGDPYTPDIDNGPADTTPEEAARRLALLGARIDAGGMMTALTMTDHDSRPLPRTPGR